MFDRPALMMVIGVATAGGRVMGQAPSHRSGRASGVQPRKKIWMSRVSPVNARTSAGPSPAGGCREGVSAGDDPVHQVAAGTEPVDVQAIRIRNACCHQMRDTVDHPVGVQVTIGHAHRLEQLPHHRLTQYSAAGIVGLQPRDAARGPECRVPEVTCLQAEPWSPVEVDDQRIRALAVGCGQ